MGAQKVIDAITFTNCPTIIENNNQISFFQFKGFIYLIFHMFLSYNWISDSLFRVGWLPHFDSNV